MSTGARRSPRTACSPPNPPPTTTTRGRVGGAMSVLAFEDDTPSIHIGAGRPWVAVLGRRSARPDVCRTPSGKREERTVRIAASIVVVLVLLGLAGVASYAFLWRQERIT